MKKNNFFVSVLFAALLLVPAWGIAETGLAPASFKNTAKIIKPSVVNISTVKNVGLGYQFGGEDPALNDFFQRFFGQGGRGNQPHAAQPRERQYKQRSLGSGFIISKDGYIVTNNHVVEGADEIKVKLFDKREFDATVVGRDPKTDVAVIQLKKAKNLVPAHWGSSDTIEVGDWALAVGSPFGLEQTVSHGIISAKGRVIGAGPYDDFLQTDAPINPGNSGGPLVNLQGEVIGINTAITTRSGGSEGIGFAIPSDLAHEIYDELIKHGKVTRGWLGVQIQELDEDLRAYFNVPAKRDGVVITSVMEEGPAHDAGFQSGDVLVKFNGKVIKSVRDLQRVVAISGIGRKVQVEIWRSKKLKTMAVTIGDMADNGDGDGVEVKERTEIGLQVRGIRGDELSSYGLRKRLGVVVEQVKGGSPAEDAGLRKGDLIIEINHQAIYGRETFRRAAKSLKGGKKYIVKIKRGKGTLYLRLEPDA